MGVPQVEEGGMGSVMDGGKRDERGEERGGEGFLSTTPQCSEAVIHEHRRMK